MPRTVKENLTNILIIIVTGMGGFMGNQIISNQTEMQKDITAIKVSVGISNQKNIDQDSDIKRLQDAKSVVNLFKHEPIFTLQNK